MYQFYVPQIGSQSIIILPESEIKHFHVLRLSPKENVLITDGQGTQCVCKINEISKKNISLQIIEKQIFKQKESKNIIAIAPTKGNDRFEWFVEKATELGIDEIWPFYGKFSERKKLNLDRIERILIAALKQSLGVFLPKVRPICSFESILQLISDHCQCYIALCNGDEIIDVENIIDQSKDTIMIIGPEGGFTSSEIELAKQNNWKQISFGNKRLRTETAGIVALNTLQFVKNR